VADLIAMSLDALRSSQDDRSRKDSLVAAFAAAPIEADASHIGDVPEDVDTIDLGGRNYATQAGLARLLGVTTRTLARWDERRIGPPKIKVGKLVLYDLAKLPCWLEGHENAPVAKGKVGARNRT
jgi:hypothetical protein